MKYVTVLSPGYLSANSQSLLHPLLFNRRLLADRGVRIKLITQPSADAYDCDFLLIDSKFYRADWDASPTLVLDQLGEFSDRIDSVLWFHTGDSAGALGKYVKNILPYVKGLYKSQIYKDKSLYQQSLYGNRLYTDFYNRSMGIVDQDPVESDPQMSVMELDKIKVSWNIGYARCFDFLGTYLSAMYKKFPVDVLLAIRPRIRAAESIRNQGIYSRMGLNFPRETISYQRKKLAELVGPQTRVSRRQYYREMKKSRVVVSPFGWGEINTRDFEAFIYGNLLVKPSMDHLETFPNFFQPNETYLPYRWDLSDMEEVIFGANDDYRSHREIAIEAQRRYISDTMSDQGRQKFVEHFLSLLQS